MEKYKELEQERKQYEKKAVDIASISLPYIIESNPTKGRREMPKSPSQGFNGGLITSLKGKIGMALLPPSVSSFSLLPSGDLAKVFESEEATEQLAVQIATVTEQVNKEIEAQQIRPTLYDLLQEQLVVGSAVVRKDPMDGLTLFTLQSFVVELDSKGRPTTIITKEVLPQLPDTISLTIEPEAEGYELYTTCVLDPDSKNGSWILTQDIQGEPLPIEKHYKSYDELPYRYFGWTWITGGYYHRPMCEEHYPDMLQLDNLAKLNTMGALASAKIVYAVNPRGAGRTRKKDFVNASNGDVIDGSADDVQCITTDKAVDFRSSNEREMLLKKELGAKFLDSGANVRDAERVTAEEIRMLAQELESSKLSGFYSKMAVDWQKWIVGQVMSELKIKFENIEVKILTGLDSLGKSQEIRRLDMFMERVTTLQLNHYIKERELLSRYARDGGVNPTNLLKTSKEVQAEQQQQQQLQAETMMAENAVKQQPQQPQPQG